MSDFEGEPAIRTPQHDLGKLLAEVQGEYLPGGVGEVMFGGTGTCYCSGVAVFSESKPTNVHYLLPEQDNGTAVSYILPEHPQVGELITKYTTFPSSLGRRGFTKLGVRLDRDLLGIVENFFFRCVIEGSVFDYDREEYGLRTVPDEPNLRPTENLRIYLLNQALGIRSWFSG